MYRRSLQDMDPVDIAENGHSFLHRVAELPLSRATLEQLSNLYHKAQEQKLLALGLKAGESTIRLAGMVALPVINKLPVESLDSIACRQLDRLEHVAPVIKKEPNEILTASGELYNKARSLPANTVQAVKEAGMNTVNGVKNYAVETVNPTLERVDKVKSYSTEKIHTATAYSRDKIDGVKSTYNGVRSGELVRTCYDSMKGGVVQKYENVKSGVVHQYEGIVQGVIGVKEGAVQKYENVTEGVKHQYEDAKTGLYNYASETVQPTVSRYTAIKEYGTEKISNTYNGVKSLGTSAVEIVTENRVVKSVREGRLMSGITDSIGGLIGYMENKMDELLPVEKGTAELNPASPEAGTWTRSMVLVSNLKGRMLIAGQQRMKTYTVAAEDLMTSLKGYKQAMIDRTQNAYQSSHDYISQTYASTRERLAYPSQYLSERYNAGRQFVYGSYQGGIESYNHTVERSRMYWDSVKSNMISTKERIYTTVHTVQTNSVAAKERLTETWTSGRSKVTTVYDYVYETALFGKDYAVKVSAPIRQWYGRKNSVEEEDEEMEMPTSVMRPISSEE